MAPLQSDACVLTKENISTIDQQVSGKRIVLLGENSHGIADYYTIKKDIIRHLHKKHGFKLVVMESSFFEASFSRMFGQHLNTTSFIKNVFLDIYHNKEMASFLDENWTEPINILGMDPQPTYSLISNELIKWLKIHTDNELYIHTKEFEHRFFEVDQKLMTGGRGVKKEIKKIIPKYEHLLELLSRKNQLYKRKDTYKILISVEQDIKNRLWWLKVNLKGYISTGVLRGFYMYKNLEWIMDFYKNEKIIVWAHNFHIRKKQTLTAKLLGIKSVGYWLEKNYPNESYSIGFYAGSGKFATQLRVELDIAIPKKNHMETLLNQLSARKAMFIPVGLNKKGWHSKSWLLLESGFMGLSSVSLVPEKHYDALIFLKDVSPPKYLE